MRGRGDTPNIMINFTAIIKCTMGLFLIFELYGPHRCFLLDGKLTFVMTGKRNCLPLFSL
jgi:hypothetical protein